MIDGVDRGRCAVREDVWIVHGDCTSVLGGYRVGADVGQKPLVCEAISKGGGDLKVVSPWFVLWTDECARLAERMVRCCGRDGSSQAVLELRPR